MPVGRVFVLAYKCRLRAYIYKLGLKFELGGGLGLKFEPGLKFERGLGIFGPSSNFELGLFLKLEILRTNFKLPRGAVQGPPHGVSSS